MSSEEARVHEEVSVRATALFVHNPALAGCVSTPPSHGLEGAECSVWAPATSESLDYSLLEMGVFWKSPLEPTDQKGPLWHCHLRLHPLSGWGHHLGGIAPVSRFTCCPKNPCDFYRWGSCPQGHDGASVCVAGGSSRHRGLGRRLLSTASCGVLVPSPPRTCLIIHEGFRR